MHPRGGRGAAPSPPLPSPREAVSACGGGRVSAPPVRCASAVRGGWAPPGRGTPLPGRGAGARPAVWLGLSLAERAGAGERWWLGRAERCGVAAGARSFSRGKARVLVKGEGSQQGLN